MVSKTVGRLFFYILSAAIGVVFIFGAYAKLISIEPFEWSLAETGFLNFTAANVFSRLFIALEFFVGALFIGGISLQGKVYKVAVALLVFFNIYLLWILCTYGNNGNCGCFGEALKMTPMQAYFKNIAMLFVIYIFFFLQNKYAVPYSKWQIVLVSLLAIGYTSWLQPPDFIYLKEKQSVAKHKINLDILYSAEASSLPTFDYKKGKHIISILSTGCMFCKKAARKMHSMQMRNKNLPMYNVILGDSISAKMFLQETLASNVAYQVNENTPYLYKLANNRLPCILWIEDGNVVRLSNYFNLTQPDIENWIKK